MQSCDCLPMITSRSQRHSTQKLQTRTRFANVARKLKASSTRFAVAKKSSTRNLHLKAHFSLRRKKTSTHSAAFVKSSAEHNLSRKNAHASSLKKPKKHAAPVVILKRSIKKQQHFVKKKLNFAGKWSKRRTHWLHRLPHLPHQRLHSKRKKTQLLPQCAPLQISAKVLRAKKDISNHLLRALMQSPKKFLDLKQLALKHNHALIQRRAIMQSLRWRSETLMQASKVSIHNLKVPRIHSMQQRKPMLNL